MRLASVETFESILRFVCFWQAVLQCSGCPSNLTHFLDDVGPTSGFHRRQVWAESPRSLVKLTDRPSGNPTSRQDIVEGTIPVPAS